MRDANAASPLAFVAASPSAHQVAGSLRDGELVLLLIRLYRNLSLLVGSDRLQRRHWFLTANRHTGGVPAEPEVPLRGMPCHPLLTIRFRDPPLRHGSRFGSRQQRGMFYGSRSRIGCLVEGALYALLFWEGLIDPPPAPIRRCQTLFADLL